MKPDEGKALYPSLSEELEKGSSTYAKLKTVALHLTRCFEQPNIAEVVDALSAIRREFIAQHGIETIVSKLNYFYESLESNKAASPVASPTSSSLFRRYPLADLNSKGTTTTTAPKLGFR